MKKLGVIGGLGPLATAYYMELLTRMTDAATDQEHLEAFIYSCPSIPDRTGYILNSEAADPVPDLVKAGTALVRAGAEHITIPCITAHYFHDTLQRQLAVPVTNLIAETVQVLHHHQIRKVGILATEGTIRSGIFQNALEQQGIACVLPDDTHIAVLMHIIYENIKAGHPVRMDQFQEAADQLWAQGAEIIILGCTELSLIKRDQALPAQYLDVLEVLARTGIHACGAPLKKEYEELL